MKKKIIIIVSIIVVLALAVGGAYLIDKNRMDNNKPVIFSTWGYDYAPPEVLGEIVKIIDRTVTENLPCDTAFEKFYEDAENEYYFNCIKSDYIIVEYANGYKEDIKAALESGNATLADLRKFNIAYTIKTRDKEDTNTVTIHHNSVHNIEKLHSFMDNTSANNKNRQDDSIKIIYYTIEGDPIIKDIKYVHNESEFQAYYEVTTDRTVDKFGTQTITTEKYDTRTISKKERNGYVDILLTQHPLACLSEELEPVTICSIPKEKFEVIIEENSFIATIVEEEPTYLIVEPSDGEMEKLQSNTRKILIADGENRDYYYGVGRKVIITYDNKIQSDTNTIISATIDVDGYDNFELEVIESEKLEKRKILDNKDIDKLNSDYGLYYYGLEEVNVKVAGKEMSLEKALKDGYLTLSGILVKANKDVKEVEDAYAERETELRGGPMLFPIKTSYDDGGSVEYRYINYTIIKYHKLDGNRDMYICKAGTTLNDLNK